MTTPNQNTDALLRAFLARLDADEPPSDISSIDQVRAALRSRGYDLEKVVADAKRGVETVLALHDRQHGESSSVPMSAEPLSDLAWDPDPPLQPLRFRNEPVRLAAADGALGAASTAADPLGLRPTWCTLQDQNANKGTLHSDRQGRVFVHVPIPFAGAARACVVINARVFRLRSVNGDVFQIVDLCRGDLEDLADAQGLIQATWEQAQ